MNTPPHRRKDRWWQLLFWVPGFLLGVLCWYVVVFGMGPWVLLGLLYGLTGDWRMRPDQWWRTGAFLAAIAGVLWLAGLALATLALRPTDYLRGTTDELRRLASPLRAVRNWIRPSTEIVELDEEWDSIPSVAWMPYDEYLLSWHWKQRRKIALSRARDRCQLCNSKKQLQAHHRTYKRLGNERPDDLIVLCRSCHEAFHEHGRMPDRD